MALLLTLAAYGYFSTDLAPKLSNNSWLNIAVGLAVSLGVYIALYNFLVWLFGAVLEDKINPREAISGEWIYRITVLGANTQSRYGICTIEKVRDEYVVSGIHYHPLRASFTSKFVSTHVHLRGGELTVLYKSAGVDEEVYVREGVYRLTTQGTPPDRISGVWADMPSKNSGEIIMQRRTKAGDAILRTHGFPIDKADADRILLQSAMGAAESPPLQVDEVPGQE
ncbi:hypothetical protein [Ornithinimicrobium sediminis]|uniref:hypothetical protein n=1 Tax=Ornithinimicrobium sediminis TaxID=2904603 RepID=UPI001E2F75E0|nr:hypothetical protein [Ornithinimicrobium sediminis]MCE0485416.1 hypothetical protein [Ornithinimicrobium sediminis]